jgi:hypothetical protein
VSPSIPTCATPIRLRRTTSAALGYAQEQTTIRTSTIDERAGVTTSRASDCGCCRINRVLLEGAHAFSFEHIIETFVHHLAHPLNIIGGDDNPNFKSAHGEGFPFFWTCFEPTGDAGSEQSSFDFLASREARMQNGCGGSIRKARSDRGKVRQLIFRHQLHLAAGA